MTATSFLTFLIVMIGVNASPGPGMAAIIGATLKSGVRAGLAVYAGSLLGDYVYFIAAVAGAGAIALALGPWLSLLTVIAGLYLLWLGSAPLRQALANSSALPVTPISQTPPSKAQVGTRAGFASGLFITLGNPGVIFFFLALLPAVTDLTHLTLHEIALMSLLLVGASCAVFAIVILVAALTRRHVLVGGRGRWADPVSGVLLALAGFWLIWDGSAKLLELVH